MKKSLISIVAFMFTLAFGVAQAAKHEAPKKEDPVAAACKGKKAGDEVTVGDKKVKCPAPKKEMKKKTTEPAPAPAPAPAPKK
jgi:hypothetical protein